MKLNQINNLDTISSEFKEHISVANQTLIDNQEILNNVSSLIIEALKFKGKILLFGNGGSASDSQHIAAEIVGRYKTNRTGLPALSLNTDTSIITAIANDFGYESIFSRQVQALANDNDIVIGLSTGGTSINVINGLLEAKKIGCKTIGFSGKGGGKFKKICDYNIIVPSNDTARIQEMHILIGHVICQSIDLDKELGGKD